MTRSATRVRLGAMNSINWGRVLAQIPYYVTATRAVGRCDVVVPSGNFGNVLAGWYARQMGAPIERLVIGSNAQRRARPLGRDRRARRGGGGATRSARRWTSRCRPTTSGSCSTCSTATAPRPRRCSSASAMWARSRCPTRQGSSPLARPTTTSLRRSPDAAERTGYIVDPHTAVGLHAVDVLGLGRERPVVCLSTAHPAKFPDAVVRAIGAEPEAPERLAARSRTCQSAATCFPPTSMRSASSSSRSDPPERRKTSPT